VSEEDEEEHFNEKVEKEIVKSTTQKLNKDDISVEKKEKSQKSHSHSHTEKGFACKICGQVFEKSQ